MRIASGKLDRRLELLAAGPTTTIGGGAQDAFGQIVPDAFGQAIATYATVATIYAQRLEMRTQDAARAGGRETFAMARFLIRWRANIGTTMRIRVDGLLYDIIGIEEPDRRATLILTVEQVKQ